MRDIFYLVVFINLLIILAGCSPTTVNTYCEVYNPIYSSTNDTEKTKVQIDNNNAVYDGLCK